MTTPKPCGRLDAHPPHNWTRPRHINEPTAPHFHCDRPPRIEGGWTCLACDQPAVDRNLCVKHGRWAA